MCQYVTIMMRCHDVYLEVGKLVYCGINMVWIVVFNVATFGFYVLLQCSATFSCLTSSMSLWWWRISSLRSASSLTYHRILLVASSLWCFLSVRQFVFWAPRYKVKSKLNPEQQIPPKFMQTDRPVKIVGLILVYISWPDTVCHWNKNNCVDIVGNIASHLV